MNEKYKAMVARAARNNLERLELTGATAKSLRRAVAFDLAVRHLSQTLPSQERQELLTLALELGYLQKGELVSDDVSLSSLVQSALKGCSDSRPRVAI